MKIIVALGVLTLLWWFRPVIRHEIWWRRWARLPGHNPYKRGDSE